MHFYILSDDYNDDDNDVKSGAMHAGTKITHKRMVRRVPRNWRPSSSRTHSVFPH